MALGHADAMRQREAIRGFFGWEHEPALNASSPSWPLPDSRQNWMNESRARRLVRAGPNA
jgi:hypothetical protein